MAPVERRDLMAHVRAQFEASRSVRDPVEIKRLLATGRRDLDRITQLLWMAK